MSSMRNAVQRRNHKERAQPEERQKWGILEKHKDYSLRAKDFNEKKKRLKILRQKAAERNPDEFHFGMMSGKTHSGGQKLADRGNKVLSHEAVKLLKTQDAGYLRTMIQKTKKERNKLEDQLVLSEGGGAEVLGAMDQRNNSNPHIVYVESIAEQKAFEPERFFGTTTEGLARRYNRPRVPEDVVLSDDEVQESEVPRRSRDDPMNGRGADAEKQALKEARALQKRHLREQQAKRSKIEALKVRERDLTAAQEELDLQRAKMSNNVGGITKAGIKWKIRERKK